MARQVELLATGIVGHGKQNVCVGLMEPLWVDSANAWKMNIAPNPVRQKPQIINFYIGINDYKCRFLLQSSHNLSTMVMAVACIISCFSKPHILRSHVPTIARMSLHQDALSF
jgi:hypothetical protein